MTQYKVSYEYVSPGPAGPYKGRTVLEYKPTKGDIIYAVFGRATVKSVRKSIATR